MSLLVVPVIVAHCDDSGPPIVRTFRDSEELFAYLDVMREEGAKIRAVGRGDQVMTGPSLSRLNFYLHSSGVAVLYFQNHPPGERSAIAWAEFCELLALNWRGSSGGL